MALRTGGRRSGAELTDSYELFDRVNQQDFEAAERCQLGVGSRNYATGGVLGPNEHHIARFHDFVRKSVEKQPTR